MIRMPAGTGGDQPHSEAAGAWLSRCHETTVTGGGHVTRAAESSLLGSKLGVGYYES